MRRCLIAIFALHFFLSVSAFSWGNLHGAQVEQARAEGALHAEAATAATVVPEDQGGERAFAKHALVDNLPDLPESLPRTAATQRTAIFGGPAVGYRQRAMLPLALDGLLRPPQQAISAA